MRKSGQLKLENIPYTLRNQIKETFQLKNPIYEQAIRVNPRVRYSLSPYIRYWKEDTRTGDMVLPRGTETILLELAKRSGIHITVIDEQVEITLSKPFKSKIKLRDYQIGVVEEALKRPQGVLRLDTGWGKTILGMKIIEALNQKTLIIVPKLDLLNQWTNDLKNNTGYKNIGAIQGSRCNIQDITVATIQSLKNYTGRYDSYASSFGSILVDECHAFVTGKRIHELSQWPVRYFYGLTATDRRTDGQGEAINWIFGEKLVDRKIPRLAPTVSIIEFGNYMPVQEYADMIEDQTNNTDRNALIVNIIKQEVKAKKKILVLTKRIEHYKVLSQMLKDNRSVIFHSSQKREEREILLASLRSGEKDYSCIFGTFSLLSTGIDIPNLDTLIIAGDLKSDVLAEQSSGRVLRLFEGKPNCKIIDIWDTGNGILRRQGKLRQQFYEKEKWKQE